MHDNTTFLHTYARSGVLGVTSIFRILLDILFSQPFRCLFPLLRQSLNKSIFEARKVRIILFRWSSFYDFSQERSSYIIRPPVLRSASTLVTTFKYLCINIIGSTLKPWYNKPRYSEFSDIVNKTQLPFWGFLKHSTFDIVNYSI